MERNWHPVMATVENPGGTWRLIDSLGHEYGRVEIRRTVDGIRYRAEHQGELIGWGTTLLESCDRVHAAFLAAHGPQGGPLARWGEESRPA